MKKCTVCYVEKQLEEFAIRRRKLKSGEVKEYRKSQCKECMARMRREWGKENPDKVKKYNTGPDKNYLTAKRRAALKYATVSWANLVEIRKLYKKAKEIEAITGVPHEVDHIVPLQGANVCGLHVEYNMQVIPASENRKKSNLY